MRTSIRCGAAVVVLLLASTPAVAQTFVDELAWAYAITPGPAPPAPADDGTKYSLTGSTSQFTLDQIRNRMGPADWYPGDHPAMPPVVAHGREAAGIWACSLCHYPNGKGRPENASVVGLPKEYFVRQMYDFKAGHRQSADSRKPNTPIMAGFAVQMTDEEIQQAADYFSSMRWTPWIQVIETDTVPKTRISGGMHLKLDGAEAGTEPLGLRIVESPIDAEHTELLRDPRSGFIAYVPKGSVARGKDLALYGNEGVTACTVCHGQDLNGLAIVPGLRGRSPSYIARQLADMKAGKRNGAWTPLMGPVVASLGSDDILNLAAYLASLEPMP